MQEPTRKTSMKPYRSLLFVPGHKVDWVGKAVAAGADAVILDLEDSVPPEQKEEARAAVADSIASLAASSPKTGAVVRVNSIRSNLTGRDLDAVVTSGLDAVFVPKTSDRDDLIRLDALLAHFEAARGLPVGDIAVIVALETAPAIGNCEELAASPRVASLVGGGARGADLARAIGYTWTGTGLETLYIRSRVIVACRVAGVSHPLCSIWQDIADIDGLISWALMNRDLGFKGHLLIHPSHVEHVNRIFSPTTAELDHAQAMIAAFEEATARGDGALRFRGQHVDAAHVETARALLALAGGE